MVCKTAISYIFHYFFRSILRTQNILYLCIRRTPDFWFFADGKKVRLILRDLRYMCEVVSFNCKFCNKQTNNADGNLLDPLLTIHVHVHIARQTNVTSDIIFNADDSCILGQITNIMCFSSGLLQNRRRPGISIYYLAIFFQDGCHANFSWPNLYSQI